MKYNNKNQLETGPVSEYHICTNCRACQGSHLSRILDMGEIPLSNRFLKIDELHNPEPSYPLNVIQCDTCGLVQLREVISGELLFRNYAYYSSKSVPLAIHFKKTAKILEEKYLESSDDLVFEIGSNDGVFLKNFIGQYRVAGCDPAVTVNKDAQKIGINTAIDFFTYENAIKFYEQFGKAKIIFAANVFAHMDNLDTVMRGIIELLLPNGVLVIEIHYLQDLLQRCGFDQVYHEHQCYFSLRSLTYLMEQYNLKIIDVNEIEIHGTSLQVHAAFNDTKQTISDSVKYFLEKEATWLPSVNSMDIELSIKKYRQNILELLGNLHAQGKSIVGYGACAKGNTLLNYCGIGTELIDYIVDTTDYKQSTFTPGKHIPVVKPSQLYKRLPDYVLILSWNYKQYIMEKESDLARQGVKFIIPFPELQIL